MGSIQEHTDLINKIIKEVPKHFPEVVALKFDAGTARALHNPEKVFKYGNEGFPDILILCWDKRYLLFDAKTGNARLNKAQVNFDNRLHDIQSKVHVARSVNDVLTLLGKCERWWKK